VDAIARTDAVEKRKRVVIAAGKDVLSVVDALACRRVGECRRAAAKRRPRLEHQHANTLFGKARRGGEAGTAAADDDGVHQREKVARAQRRSAISARFGRGTRMRRLKTS
jgi:hypothetical protein